MAVWDSDGALPGECSVGPQGMCARGTPQKRRDKARRRVADPRTSGRKALAERVVERAVCAP